MKMAAKKINLSETVKRCVDNYLNESGIQNVTNLHDFVLEIIEPPLLRAVIEHCKYNQSKAAMLLGLSRGTCRAKLLKYFDDKYCGHRE